MKSFVTFTKTISPDTNIKDMIIENKNLTVGSNYNQREL